MEVIRVFTQQNIVVINLKKRKTEPYTNAIMTDIK